MHKMICMFAAGEDGNTHLFIYLQLSAYKQ